MDEIIAHRFKLAMAPEERAVQEDVRVDDGGHREPGDAAEPAGQMPNEVLKFHGRQDRVVPLDTSLYLIQHLKNAELMVLDKCGH